MLSKTIQKWHTLWKKYSKPRLHDTTSLLLAAGYSSMLEALFMYMMMLYSRYISSTNCPDQSQAASKDHICLQLMQLLVPKCKRAQPLQTCGKTCLDLRLSSGVSSRSGLLQPRHVRLTRLWHGGLRATALTSLDWQRASSNSRGHLRQMCWQTAIDSIVQQ